MQDGMEKGQQNSSAAMCPFPIPQCMKKKDNQYRLTGYYTSYLPN